MAPWVGITWMVYWIFLPLSLIFSVIFRYNLLSCIYLLFLLAFPYLPRLLADKITSWKSYTIALAIMSGIFLLSHVGFQIALAAAQPYGSLVGDDCKQIESIARYVGFQRLDHSDVANVFRLILPDAVVFLVSLLSLFVIKKAENTVTTQSTNEVQQQTNQSQKISSVRLKNGLILCFTMLLLALAGIAYPNVVSCVYLLIFMVLVMLWTFHQPLLTSGVAALRASLSVLTIVQLLTLYLYQFQYMQQWIPPSAIYTRLLGLTAIVFTDCDKTYKLLLQPDLSWTEFANPCCIFILHWLLAVGVRMFYEDFQILQRPVPSHTPTTRRKLFFNRSSTAEKKEQNLDYEETAATVQPLVQGEELPQNYDSIETVPQPPNNEAVIETDAADQPDQNEEILSKMSNWFSELKEQSFYVVALIVMILWSVTYHSWLTFILLLWSCILWMTKHKAKYTMYCSPILVAYGIILVLAQYVYSLNLYETELPTKINQTNGDVIYLSAFGLRRYTDPCLHLGAQILYLCGFWLVLHQFNYIRTLDGTSQHENARRTKESWTESAALYIYELLCKYWIFVVVGFHLAVSTEGYPTGIKIVYMIFFLLNVITYSISWFVWRKSLTLYWTVLVVYSMIVLTLIYTYQFQSFPGYWKSFTNFSDAQLADLGLVQYYHSGQLLLQILIPALFLLAVILQLQYFNSRFLEITQQPTRISPRPSNASEGITQPNLDVDEYEMNDLSQGNESGNWLTRKLYVWWPVFLKGWNALLSFLIRALEFHMWKLVFITVFSAAVYEVSALYAIFVVFWVLVLPLRKLHSILFLVSLCVASLVVLGIMVYQLQFILPDVTLTYNCSFGEYGNRSFHLTNWIGADKMTENSIFFYYVQGYLAIILMIALERTIIRRQKWRRIWRNEPSPMVTAFYPSVTHEVMDNGLLQCLKFFINYFFLKFGVETCCVMTVITVWVRTDVFSVIYCLLLIIVLSLKTRASLFRFWRFYVMILTILLLWQYFTNLGMPPVWCQDHNYPWDHLNVNASIQKRLIYWLHLPNYILPVDLHSSLADFFQLLFVVCQLFVFKQEKHLVKYVGDNHYLTGKELDQITICNNPKKNFMLKESRTLLDQLKVFTFKYTIWITMAIVFFAGTSRISIFTLGYLISFFYLVTKQQTLLMGKPSHLLRVFVVLIGYTVAVITMKVGLQVASCVYIEVLKSKACVFVQLMSLVCAKPSMYDLSDKSTNTCEVSYDNAGLTWDFVCFLFLLIQQRIFASYYFLHVAEDMRISMQLAARGAELFNDKLIAEVNKREKMQEETINTIKISMECIKDGYHSLRRHLSTQITHVDATRSGDYYMFRDDTSVREDLSVQPDEIMTPFSMLHKADTVGINEALEGREKDKKKLAIAEEPEAEAEASESDENSDDADATHIPATSDDKHETASVDRSSSVEQDRDSRVESEIDEEEKKKSFLEKVKQFCSFTYELLLSGVDSLILFLNEQNKDYRNIILQLGVEKDHLCDKNLKQQVLSPRSTSSDITIDIDDENTSTTDVVRKTSSVIEFEEVKPIDFDKDQNRLLRLFYALWYVISSGTDVVCYFIMVLNLMLKASVLALVLPLAVLLWATFSIPRPTKRFWNFTILYLEIVIVVKFLFQFEFFPWNSQATTNIHDNDPFWWPRIIGIEQSPSWGVMDLLQLLAVFFHISILKVHGLWDEVEDKNAMLVETISDSQMIASTSHVDAPGEKENGGEKEEEEETFVEKVKSVFMQPYYHYYTVLNQRFSSVTDVYLYMFICDVTNFLIIIFGYTAFGAYVSTDSNVVSNIKSNNVPTAFLVMLLIQFVIMFIDRAIYLMKNMVAKVIFQIVLVILIHVWMFFILPYVNERPFYKNHVAQIWYFIKVLYFLFSAYQIRAGYPKSVAGNFLTKSFGTANLFLFKGYRAIPFLAEITAIMDWMYTGTSMGIGEWMKVWAIHAEVFELKCWRVFEANYPSPRGRAKAIWLKYLLGGLLVFLLLAIIWFPLLLMNIALTIGGVPNNPIQVEMKISIGAFEPLFQVVADTDNITTWSKNQFKNFERDHSDKASASFLQSFSNDQVVSVEVDGQSKTIWIISPPQRALLIQRLSDSNHNPVGVVFEWTLTKNAAVTKVVTSSGYNKVSLARNDTARIKLHKVLSGIGGVTNVTIPKLFPQYIHSSGSSTDSKAAKNLYYSDNYHYMDVDFQIQSSNKTLTSWWSMNEDGSTEKPKISLFVFSDKVSPSSLNFLVNYGIIGLYISVVLVVGRLVRTVFIGTTASIMFTELPYVDRILGLCNDIFLVREEGEYELEEDLYAKLIFVYRSPATLIQWTRKPKQE